MPSYRGFSLPSIPVLSVNQPSKSTSNITKIFNIPSSFV
ncbi:hypothetical protein AVDCRST_MAG92-4142 [uncultured Coleofasciculus sp.]|uniref:Uncharacterized protein n=1 Tax=uncultured Coleofasciculus sp. TaxID=1267456 RepID=A0A6J4JW59_9CYAN|nr:hypothetical protein AVDCRST_MAG92-4142 [uncultured Coleofasciculus sp.]